MLEKTPGQPTKQTDGSSNKSTLQGTNCQAQIILLWTDYAKASSLEKVVMLGKIREEENGQQEDG